MLRARDMLHVERARLHALKRLRQRFGIELDEMRLKAIEAELVSGHYRWVACVRQAIIYEAPIAGKTTYPIFSIPLWAIVTFVTAPHSLRAAVVGEPR